MWLEVAAGIGVTHAIHWFAALAANASNIWLPVEFTANNLVKTPLEYRDAWDLDLEEGTWKNSTVG